MIPDFVVREAVEHLLMSGCTCEDFCLEGGAGAGKSLCGCFCHRGQALTFNQRVEAAKLIGGRFSSSRRAAVLTLLLHGVAAPAPAPIEEVRA